MSLPFTAEQFLEVFRTYNQSVWPAQVALHGVAFALVALPATRSPLSNRAASALLALLWAWAGVAYHLLHFSAINRAAFLFGALFLLQALLLFWLGALRRKLRFEWRGGRRGIVAIALLLYALLVYPLLGQWLGHRYPAAPTFGAPCPVTIFTVGLLHLSVRPIPRAVLAIPVLWSAVGGSAALLLGIREDLGLLLAGGLGVLLAIGYQRQRSR